MTLRHRISPLVRTRQRAWVIVALTLLLAQGCADPDVTDGRVTPTDAPAGAEPPTTDPPQSSDSEQAPVRATKVIQLPALATTLASTPRGDEFLVGDRSGVVRRLVREAKQGNVVPRLDDETVLDLSDSVTTEFDRGFINMELVNEGTSLVVMYTGRTGELRIEQYPYRTGRPIDRDAVRVLAATPWDYPFHHGGGLDVDADGNLLVGLGDKGLPVSQLVGEQSNLLLGGVTSVPRTVLEDPELAWQPTAEAMFARGLRNPWRLSVDSKTGDVFVGDVGNLDFEEVNRITQAELSEGSQPNFGHPYFEGPKQLAESVPESLEPVPAVLARSHDDGACGMVSGQMYRDGPIDPLNDLFIYTDLCAMELRGFALNADGFASDDQVLGELPESLVSIDRGPDQQLFGLGSAGGVYRIDPSWWQVADSQQSAIGPDGEEGPVSAPVDKPEFCQVIDQIFQAIEPLDAVSGMSASTLQAELTSANDQLNELVPLLPADLDAAGATMLRTFGDLQEKLEKVNYDANDPEMEQVFDDLINTQGEFADFPDAILAFSTAGCT